MYIITLVNLLLHQSSYNYYDTQPLLKSHNPDVVLGKSTTKLRHPILVEFLPHGLQLPLVAGLSTYLSARARLQTLRL